jgi:hypothetical protein
MYVQSTFPDMMVARCYDRPTQRVVSNRPQMANWSGIRRGPWGDDLYNLPKLSNWLFLAITFGTHI